MPPVESLLSFIGASLVLIAAPGPDNLGVLSLGISRGRRAGVGFAIGCGLGCLTHTLWAVVGITAAVAAWPTAFTLLKFAGAAYLLYLGIGALRSGGALGEIESQRTPGGAPSPRLTPYLVRGFIANALNPKVGLFFLAFLPQFMDASRPAAPQAALLGALFSVMTILAFAALGAYSGAVGGWLARRANVGPLLDRLAGCVFLALAGQLVLARK